MELFPTTITLTPDGQFAFVANSDFHGDHPRVNVVSVVHTPTMTKITDIPACDMPHGVKVNHAGTRVYVSCMHSDEILQLDVATFRIARRARTGEGHAMASTGPAHHGPAAPLVGGVSKECSPTFVSVSPDDKRLYVACNYGNSLQVWDAATLTKIKEIPVGKGGLQRGAVTRREAGDCHQQEGPEREPGRRGQADGDRPHPHQQEDRARGRLLA